MCLANTTAASRYQGDHDCHDQPCLLINHRLLTDWRMEVSGSAGRVCQLDKCGGKKATFLLQFAYLKPPSQNLTAGLQMLPFQGHKYRHHNDTAPILTPACEITKPGETAELQHQLHTLIPGGFRLKRPPEADHVPRLEGANKHIQIWDMWVKYLRVWISFFLSCF